MTSIQIIIIGLVGLISPRILFLSLIIAGIITLLFN